MKQLLTDIQNRLQAAVATLKYIDEDWGQLDYYNVAHPVKYPCALINISTVNFSNEGELIQQGLVNIVITIADIKLTNTSANAPQLQKQSAWKVFDTIEAVHKALHGWTATNGFSKLSRTQITKRKNDEGLNLYDVIFTTNWQDATAKPVHTMKLATPEVSMETL